MRILLEINENKIQIFHKIHEIYDKMKVDPVPVVPTPNLCPIQINISS